jgi:hypothetical protein
MDMVRLTCDCRGELSRTFNISAESLSWLHGNYLPVVRGIFFLLSKKSIRRCRAFLACALLFGNP